MQKSIPISIPEDVDFASLQLARDPSTGTVRFAWEPIERICSASGIDPALFRDQGEDNVCALIVTWYIRHRQRGGTPDAIADDLIAETLTEDERGAGISHKPGRA